MDDETIRDECHRVIAYLDHHQLTALLLFLQRFPRPLTDGEEMSMVA